MSLGPVASQQFLELVYGLLPDKEAAALRTAISADTELAAAYARAQAAATLLAQAARLPAPPIALRRPDTLVAVPFVRPTPAVETPRQKPPLVRTGPEVRRPWARWAGWTVGVAATVLLALAAGGYYYHRSQLGDMAAGPVRVLLAGPPWLEAGHAPRFSLLTTSLAGQPVSAQIELGFWSPDGQHLGGHKEQTDEQGRLEVTLPADSRVFQAPEVRLVAQVFREKLRPGLPLETRLAVRPEGTILHLALEKAVLRPGDTLRLRVLAVKRSRLGPGPMSRLRCEVRDPSGAVISGSRRECPLRQGLGWVECSLPQRLPDGQYTVVATALDGTGPEVRRTFLVRSAPSPQSDKSPLRKLHVGFFPEGGELVAGLENRVYLSVRDTHQRPVRITGRVVDRQNRPVALVETGEHGLGAFSIEPVLGEAYRLQIETPEGVEDSPQLPAASNSGIALSTGQSVFEPGKPLEFVVRSKEAGVPLVAAAWCRGVAVGQLAFVTQTQASAGPTPANPVILPVDDWAAGVIHLCIFDYRTSPPRRVAQRLVFRRPGPRLHLQAAPIVAHRTPLTNSPTITTARPTAEQASSQLPRQISVQVTDEEGKPAPALLAAWLSGTGSPEQEADQNDSLLASVLLGPDLVEAGALRHLGPIPLGRLESEKTLDLVLATSGAPRSANPPEPAQAAKAQTSDQPAGAASAPTGPPQGEVPPCTVLDNLAQLKTEYQDRLDSYRKHRTRVLNTLITLIIFGGVGLVLFVSMANLLNIPCGLRLWVPTLATAAICLTVGLELLHPERHVGPAQGVAFASYQHPVSQAVGRPAGRHSPPHAPAPATTAGPSATGTESAQPSGAGQPIAKAARHAPFWNPTIPTDARGKAVIVLDRLTGGAGVRLLVEAYSPSGRLGALELETPGSSLSSGSPQAP